MIGDLKSRQRMLEWIWDYGNKRIEDRLKYEGEHPLDSNKLLRLLIDPRSSKVFGNQAKGQNYAEEKPYASQGSIHSRLQGTTCKVYEMEGREAQPKARR